MNPLLEILGFAGNVLDTPGAMVRNALTGRNPFQGMFAPEDRTTGRGMLEQWGLLDENTAGLDAGDMAGFIAEMLADPLNLIGAGWAKHALRGAKEAKAANAASDALRASGAMPEEIAHLTKAVDDTGSPMAFFHGSRTPTEAGMLDPAMAGQSAQHGSAGVYFTPDPATASWYGRDGGVTKAFLDIRNPLDPRDVIDEFGPGAREFALSRGHDAIMVPDEVAVLNKSQIYSPYIAPAMQPVPSVRNPLLALLGYNALQGFN